VPLFDLAAAIDDEGHFLAVLHRLNGCTIVLNVPKADNSYSISDWVSPDY
jgi:hypothetical protein